MSRIFKYLSMAKGGDRRALSKLLTIIEDNSLEANKINNYVSIIDRKAYVIGVTGIPGAGKSSLISHLIKHFRYQDNRVSVLAIDPSSAITKGSLMGDRLRMGGFENDEDVFIRSVATRGHTGGLARSTKDAIRLLDASGFNIIIVETVGAGQLDIDIHKVSDVVLVVHIPGAGDIIQNSKAGIIEIGDIFVVNKADLNGADIAVNELNVWMRLNDNIEDSSLISWIPPVIKTNSVTGDGVEDLVKYILNYFEYSKSNNMFYERRDNEDFVEVYDILNIIMFDKLIDPVIQKNKHIIIDGMRKKIFTPKSAADLLFELICENKKLQI